MLSGDGYGEIVYTPQMAFEKEMGLAFEDTKEEVQPIVPEIVEEPQTIEHVEPERPVIPLSQQPLVQQTVAEETLAATQIWQPVKPEMQTEAHMPQQVESEKTVIPLSGIL